jgi:putative restriction endonuclease
MDFNKIIIGKYYSRENLTAIWNYKGRQALSRGVVTPSNTNKIILFVTKETQKSYTQYSNYISDDYLYWDGEQGGTNNSRIINSTANNDEIHLFYRPKHHQNFEYKGRVTLETYIGDTLPYKFVFRIIVGDDIPLPEKDLHEKLPDKPTQKEITTLSRIGQGIFRIKLFDLWQGCAMSNLNFPELLRASHIKPWRDANDRERLDPYNGLLLTPTYDLLFDKGYISFGNDGKILIGKAVQKDMLALTISYDLKLRHIFDNNKRYLEYHRDTYFDKK